MANVSMAAKCVSETFFFSRPNLRLQCWVARQTRPGASLEDVSRNNQMRNYQPQTWGLRLASKLERPVGWLFQSETRMEGQAGHDLLPNFTSDADSRTSTLPPMRQVYYVKKFSQPTPYNSTRAHEEQVQAFFFTVVIITFYALTILYFMLKQICRQEKEHKRMLYNYVMGREYEQHQRERVMRATMKKQLCMHLIKMGQFTQSLVTIGRRQSLTGCGSSHGGRKYGCDHSHECTLITRDQGTEIDDDLFVIEVEETQKLMNGQVPQKTVRFAAD